MTNSKLIDEDSEIFGMGKPFSKELTKKLEASNAAPKGFIDRGPSAEVKAERAKKYTDLFNLLQTAISNGLKYPKFRFEKLVVSLAPMNGNNPGAMYVKRKTAEGEGVYLGMIKGGEYFPSREATIGDSETLAKLVENPIEAAKLSGIQTGVCCFCGLELTDPISVEMGIGPICCEKWGIARPTKSEFKASKVEAATPVVETIRVIEPTISYNASIMINGVEVTKADLVAQIVAAMIDDETFVANPNMPRQVNAIADAIINMGEMGA